MKKLLIYTILMALCACNSTIPFDFPANEKIVFCQCIFSPAEPWKVKVAYTYSFADQTFDNDITNASVFILKENSDTIWLTHYKNGEYRSAAAKPEEGLSYQLFAIVEGDTMVSSSSCIPKGVDAAVTGFDENPGTIKIDYYTSDDMYAAYCNLSMSDAVLQGLMVRAFLYDAVRGVAIFTFTQDVLESIYTLTSDSSVVKRLSSLTGDTIYGYENMDVVMQRLLGNETSNDSIEKIKAAAYAGESFQMIPDALPKLLCFTGNSDFNSTPYEKRALLGKFYESKQFTVYLLGGYDGEYWVEFNLLSPEAYLYYEGYISQLNDRVDYSSIQNPVYSNISHGVGIFAGVKKKLVRVK